MKRRKNVWLLLNSTFVRIVLVIAMLALIGVGFHVYKYYKVVKYREKETRQCMEGALLDLVNYPGSAEVVFERFDFLREQKCLHADGYVDAPNAFGAKKRLKFSFFVTFNSEDPRSQGVTFKEELGIFEFGGETYRAKDLFELNQLKK